MEVSIEIIRAKLCNPYSQEFIVSWGYYPVNFQWQALEYMHIGNKLQVLWKEWIQPNLYRSWKVPCGSDFSTEVHGVRKRSLGFWEVSEFAGYVEEEKCKNVWTDAL